EISIPSDAIKKLADSDLSVEVKLPQGSVTFDKAALAAVGASAANSPVSVRIEDAKAQLNAPQQSTVGSRPVYDISVKSGNAYVTDFGGGAVTVSIPYTLKSAEKASNLVIYYLKDDGSVEKIACTYNAETRCVVFRTAHLSKYYIGYEEWINLYGDVRETDWFYDAVRYVSEKELFGGTDVGFEPAVPMTRAMLVTVLYRYAMPARGANTTDFTDVPLDLWYSDPIAWAASSGIVTGSDGKFRPDAPITRQEVAAILFRFTQQFGEGPSGDWAIRLPYADVAEIASWANEPAMWVTMKGIITGRPGDLFAPAGTATRAEVATMLMRYIEAAK
ncbi:MAG: S-layer homology domain-containing protein, partial [Clostridiales Family XIII bacterium]|nr:S-layer homology domain-containing protein [Clostridiales Family XIII bacterium]